jgi:NADH:ubiquinone oxidoreductase subunit 6 (subunit J)
MEQQGTLAALLAAPSVESWLFYILGTLSICLAIGVIADRVIIRCGFLLIGVFGTISGIFLLLQAQFLALAQVMIYAVGITLVVVIALMLTNPRLEAEAPAAAIDEKASPLVKLFNSVKRNIVLWVSVLSFVTIYAALTGETHWPLSTEMMPADCVKTLGEALTTTYAIPFEFASVLLLAALMGAIMLAKNDAKDDDDSSIMTIAEEAQKAETNLALQR